MRLGVLLVGGWRIWMGEVEQGTIKDIPIFVAAGEESVWVEVVVGGEWGHGERRGGEVIRYRGGTVRAARRELDGRVELRPLR